MIWRVIRELFCWKVMGYYLRGCKKDRVNARIVGGGIGKRFVPGGGGFGRI